MEPAFNYVSEQKLPPDRMRRAIVTALRRLLAGLSARDGLLWAHNLGIGRNLILTRELTRACAQRNIPLIAHHHDWWFDNRWQRWPEMRRFGVRTLKAAAQIVFPAAKNLCHIAINHADASVLLRHFPGRADWLPNLAGRNATPPLLQVRAAKRWLQNKLGTRMSPVWILPCRLLRRKNVAEALLLTRWLRPEAWLVTTGGVSSADEQAYHDKLAAAAHKQHWRIRLGVLAGDESRKPSVAELLAASEAVLLTSIQEGFGLPFLEAAAAGRPLIARNLPIIAPDLAKFGFVFPQSYDELRVAPSLFDWPAEQQRQEWLYARWRRQLPRNCQAWAGQPLVLAAGNQPKTVPFSRLTLTAQLEVLAQPVALSWELCAPLNPLLREWRSRAAAGKLRVTPWPRGAERWLGGEAYARRFREVLNGGRAQPSARNAAEAAQADFIRRKLASRHLHPLLWSTDT